MKPHIIVTSQDFDRLESVIYSLSPSLLENMNALISELKRAEIVTPEAIPSSIVTMNSKVRFSIDIPPQELCRTLVYPEEMGEGDDTISVFSPVGSALLGLAVGSEIEWPQPNGRMMNVKVIEILKPAAHVGL